MGENAGSDGGKTWGPWKGSTTLKGENAVISKKGGSPREKKALGKAGKKGPAKLLRGKKEGGKGSTVNPDGK